MAANDLKDLMGPISSVAGGVNVLSGGIKFAGTAADKMGSIDKLSYIGESVLDLVSEGKILGGTITVGGDGKTTVTTKEIDLEGKTTEEVEKELEKAGLSLPEDEDPKTTAELAEDMEEKYFYTEEEINEIIEYLRNLLYEMFLNSDEEPMETPPTEESTAPPAEEIGGLSIDEIVGTYDIVLSNDDGDTEEIQNVYTKNENGQLVRNGAAMDYDPITGTSTYTHTFDDGDYITQTLVFSSENGRISISGTILAVGKGRSTTYIKGTKID